MSSYSDYIVLPPKIPSSSHPQSTFELNIPLEFLHESNLFNHKTFGDQTNMFSVLSENLEIKNPNFEILSRRDAIRISSSLNDKENSNSYSKFFVHSLVDIDMIIELKWIPLDNGLVSTLKSH